MSEGDTFNVDGGDGTVRGYSIIDGKYMLTENMASLNDEAAVKNVLNEGTREVTKEEYAAAKALHLLTKAKKG